MGSATFLIAALFFALGAAAGASFFLYQRNKAGDTARFFAPRSRRLSFVERAALDGGRKLLLVRRDDVEHLILVGGPIDLVVETQIRSDAIASSVAKEEVAANGLFAEPPSVWPLADPEPSIQPVAAVEPRLTVSPEIAEEKPVLDLTPAQEAKAAE